MRGADKLLQPVAGQPLLRLVAHRATGASAHVAVTLRPGASAREQALMDAQVTRLEVPDAEEGMAASLRAGARWAQGLPAQALMIALPDMPDITARDMRALIAAQADQPARPLRAATEDGRPGHPVILPRALLQDILSLHGDAGARDLLRLHPPLLFALAGNRALTDLDTPEAWDAWRAAQTED